MRGDRPEPSTLAGSKKAAAPHARGSTLSRRWLGWRCWGCPACAGIDPRRALASTSRSRLPRMRGDRPEVPWSGGSRLPAAPHARGSTPRRVRRAPRPRGCPACAGIDPTHFALKTASFWLPRMRGDRPKGIPVSQKPAWAAPHARGSTHSDVLTIAPRAGCPACAGIDPNLGALRAGMVGLPRMRGDRPETGAPSALDPPAAPHARGSTRLVDARVRDGAGCPACAGIDPRVGADRLADRGLPRMRGDRPFENDLGEDLHEGCPACAGIDPSACSSSRGSRRLPRMRGDRPGGDRLAERAEWAAPHARGSTHHELDPVSYKRGCPACAGIDPGTRCPGPSRSGLPRMRGDRPAPAYPLASVSTAAPHARGSTLDGTDGAIHRHGCPACAGIDPSAFAAKTLRARLPRMRGDRPSVAIVWEHCGRAAPHARGSTRRPAQRRRGPQGCPACAGIDPPRAPALTS